MIIEDIHFTLKDGRDAVIRSPKLEDAQPLIDYMTKTAEETDFLLRYPEECATYSVEGEERFIENVINSPNDAMLVCFVEGKVAGNCHIMFNSRIKTKHRADVAIALYKEYWNQGIGTKLFDEMIKIAKTKEYVTQLELEFIEGNSRARALYEKVGFRIVGIRPNAIKLKDGTVLNDYIMIKELVC